MHACFDKQWLLQNEVNFEACQMAKVNEKQALALALINQNNVFKLNTIKVKI